MSDCFFLFSETYKFALVLGGRNSQKCLGLKGSPFPVVKGLQLSPSYSHIVNTAMLCSVALCCYVVGGHS